MNGELLNDKQQNQNRRQYKIVGLTMFLIAIGLVAMRIVAYLVAQAFPEMSDIALDAIFSIPMQIGILVIMPFIMYKFVLKKSVKEVLSFSNVKKTKPLNLLLAVPLGFLVIILTVGVSFVWQVILIMLGYTPPSSGIVFSGGFNIWFFLANIVLTAVLPGICEEFANRGGFLSTVKSFFPLATAIILCGVSFGLFHQHIIQVFYTSCFGALMAFITIKTKSSLPAMIVHFLNNAISVYLEFASNYGWFGGNFDRWVIDALLGPQALGILLLYVAAAAAAGFIVYTIIKINADKSEQIQFISGDEKQKYAYLDRPLPGNKWLTDFIVANPPKLEVDPALMLGRPYYPVNTYSNIDPYSDEPVTVQNEPIIIHMNKRYYMLQNNMFYPTRRVQNDGGFKPELKDNVFFIAAIAVTVFTTLISFISGWII